MSRTWFINKSLTLVDDRGALTFDLGDTALSLLPDDVPKVHAALGEWLKAREPTVAELAQRWDDAVQSGGS